MHASSYQREDALFALSAAKLCGIDIGTPEVKRAVRESVWGGRFETVREKPRIILDGSHNEEGIRALCNEMPKLARPLIAVFTALADKRGIEMRRMLRAECDELIITQFSHARADTAEHLSETDDLVIPDYRKAVQTAIAHAGTDGTVLITGSLYFISVIRKEFT
jgi:dihydrofolate synthase/folylpolyglutamate synthase